MFSSIIIDGADASVAIVSIDLPEGRLRIMAEIEVETDQKLIVARDLHMHGEGFEPNQLGARRLRKLAVAILEEIDYVECRIEGAVRTTGSNPGHRPKPIRFKRRRDPSD